MKLYLQLFSFADSWRAVISYWNKYGNSRRLVQDQRLKAMTD